LSISLGWGHQHIQPGSWTQTASVVLTVTLLQARDKKINWYAAHLKDLFKKLRNFSSDTQDNSACL